MLRYDSISDPLVAPEHKSNSSANGETNFSFFSLLLGEVDKPLSNNKYVTIFMILNTMIGSGILNQPQVFLESGIIGALLMFSISSYFIWLGLMVLVDCGIRHYISDFSALARFTFGSAGESFVDFAIVLNSIGDILSYITVIGGTSSDLVDGWGCSGQSICGMYVITSFIICLFVLPLCLFQYYGHLGILSVISITAITSILFLIIIGGPFLSSSGPIILFSITGMLTKMGSIVFALSCSAATFHAYESMKNRSLALWSDVTFWSVIIGASMCCIMGLVGYLCFKENTDGMILDNFTGNYADFFKVILVLHLCLYIPVDFLIMRHSVIRLFGSETGILPIFKHTLLTVTLLAGITVIVLLLYSAGLTQGTAFGFILDFTGGIAGSFTSFVMPAAMFLKLSNKDHKFFVPSIFMFCFGIFVMITVPIVSIVDIIES